MLRRALAFAAGFCACGAAAQADTPPLLAFNQAIARPYADGAGPSALFRLGRDEVGKRDIFGLVDPNLWRIQFFTLDDWSLATPRALHDRMKPVGACQLDPTFRLWRVHELGDKVVLQTQPKVEPEALEAGKPFASDALVLTPKPAALQAIAAGTPPDLNETGGTLCGRTTTFTDDLVGQKVTGGANQPFVVKKRGLAAGASPFLQSPVTLRNHGRFLASVQELESAKTINTGSEIRHFLVTARSGSTDGFATSDVTLTRRGANATHNADMHIVIGLGRVKAGQRTVAVSSVGEVIILGTNDHKQFYFQSCTYTVAPSQAQVCRLNPTTEGQDLDGGVVSEIPPSPRVPPTQAQLWSRAWWYANQTFDLDASVIPKECRGFTACTIGGKPWLPVADLRLAKGVVHRRGVPYAQSRYDYGVPSAAGGAPDFAGKSPLPLTFQVEGQLHLVSDIENDPALKGGKTPIFGIDCSRLTSALWGRTSVLDTMGFVQAATAGTVERVRGWETLKSGDGLVINLAETINHIVIFRESRPANVGDTSRAILVVESSSSCGGVCYSFYDESFFHGWALIGPGKPTPTAYIDVPKNLADWKKVFAN